MASEKRYVPTEREKAFQATIENPKYERDIINGLTPFLKDKAPTDIKNFYSADELAALKALSGQAEVAARLSSAVDVRLLWDVCRIPDFRGISPAEHAGMLETIFGFLHDQSRVPEAWFADQIRRIDRAEGDIDALSKRLAYIRTWTYVAQRSGWVEHESHWREETRAVEDRLSDALHQRLTQRFVDRRTSVLMRRLKQKESLVAEVNDKGEVTVEGEFALAKVSKSGSAINRPRLMQKDDEQGHVWLGTGSELLLDGEVVESLLGQNGHCVIVLLLDFDVIPIWLVIADVVVVEDQRAWPTAGTVREVILKERRQGRRCCRFPDSQGVVMDVDSG